ncbi:MAG: MarC family protein [Mangrovicoccus sp.]
MALDTIINAFATLFVVIDPIGLTPIFLALTAGMDPAHRRSIALRGCAIAAVLLALFGFVGFQLLDSLGISMAAFRIAGGLLLFLIAIEMLFERRTKRREENNQNPPDDPSVFPLALPMIAGPGALATMVLLTTGEDKTLGEVMIVQLVMLCVMALVLALFSLANPIERLLGRTGTLVVTRLLGMLLAALAVQFVVDGLVSSEIFARIS